VSGTNTVRWEEAFKRNGPETAEQLLRRGCDGGDALACIPLAHVYEGEYDRRWGNAASALQVYQKLCDWGSKPPVPLSEFHLYAKAYAEGCYQLARRSDPQKAAELNRKVEALKNGRIPQN
jgi:hypothetical protein